MRILLLLCCLIFTAESSAHIKIVAAENFYGNIATTLGGPLVTVTSILNQPNQDPHLFTASIRDAKAINNADIIILNGAGYDEWMNNLITASPAKILNVAKIIHLQAYANPHIWYQPLTMPTFAKALTRALQQKDPLHKNYYQLQLNDFLTHYQDVLTKVANIKTRTEGIDIIATESIFDAMAQALGFNILNQDFALSMMNEALPTPKQILNFQQILQAHKTKLLIYNNQVSSPLSEQLKEIAIHEQIPILGISETMPPDKTYLQWMLDTLDKLQGAIAI